MPQLVAFGRRWTIGSDDFVYPGLGENLLRLAWLIAVSLIFHLHKDTFSCDTGHLLKAYYIGFISLLVINLVITSIIVYTSAQGSLTNDFPRRKIAKLIYIKFAITLPELAWNIIGAYWAFGMSSGCEVHIVMTVKGVVIAGWIIGVVVMIGIAVVFDPLGTLHKVHPASSNIHALDNQPTDSAKRVWEASGCEVHIVMTVKGVVIAGWIIGVVVMIGIAVVFDPLGTLHKVHPASSNIHALDNQPTDSAKRVWEARCKIICCCVWCDQQSTEAFSGIAEIFSNFFSGVDLVPTDVACGLILVQREQEEQSYRLTSVQTDNIPANGGSTSSSRPRNAIQNSAERKPLPSPKSWMNIEEMDHYMKFAMGSYGWPLFIFDHLMTGTCQLWSQCNYSCMSCCIESTGQTESCLESCLNCFQVCKTQSMTIIETEKEFNELCLSLECCACMIRQSEIRDDNCCRCNMAAIRKTTGVAPDDVVYASFHNKIYEIPFYVCIDRKHQSVVVSIRGTLSLRDVITDLTAECDTLEIDGLEHCKAHKGMLQAAKYVQSTLDKLGLLDQAFDRAQGARLVITGHSLGAGTAALLAILLKPKYPSLVCFAFSPPGGLMSLHASEYCQEFVCSVVLGKDIIPRLGIHTMEELKTQILQNIQDCDWPKYKLLASGVWQLFCGLKRSSLLDFNETKQKRPLLTSPRNTTQQDNMENALHEAVHHSEQCRITYPQMYPPGQVLHIQEHAHKQTCCGIPDYYTVWAHPEDFHQVLVSPKMMSDHFPDAVMRALGQLRENNHNVTSKYSSNIIQV